MLRQISDFEKLPLKIDLSRKKKYFKALVFYITVAPDKHFFRRQILRALEKIH